MHARLGTVLVSLVLATLVATASLSWPAQPAEAAGPVHGQTRWAVILCKFSDDASEPQPPQFFRDFFSESGAGQGGMFDYWKSVSYGNIDLTGSTVHGWYTLPYTADQLNVLGGVQPGGRPQKVQACVDAALNDPNFPVIRMIYGYYYGIAVMWNTDQGQFWGGQQSVTLRLNSFMSFPRRMGAIAMTPGAWHTSPVAHEMGHGYGLSHSFSNFACYPTGDPHEYCDPWDIMSYARVFSFNGPGPRFGETGPGLSAAYRSELGWMPPGQTWTYPGFSQSVRLTSVSEPSSSDFMMATIPLDASTSYVVELRRQTGLDRAFPRDAVLVRQLRADGRSYLQQGNRRKSDLVAGDSVTDPAHNIQVQVITLPSGSGPALVRIGPPIPDGPPVVTLTPNSLSLDYANVDAAQVILTNSGGSPLSIASASLGGDSPAEFSISVDRCSGALVVQGESCTLTVSFEPNAGDHRAVLVFSDTLGTQSVSLGGTTTRPTPCRTKICP